MGCFGIEKFGVPPENISSTEPLKVRRFGFIAYMLIFAAIFIISIFYVYNLFQERNNPPTTLSTKKECWTYPPMNFSFPDNFESVVGLGFSGPLADFYIGESELQVKFLDTRSWTSEDCKENSEINIAFVYENNPEQYGEKGMVGVREVQLDIVGSTTSFLPILPLNSQTTESIDMRIEKATYETFRGKKTESYVVSSSRVPDFQRFFQDYDAELRVAESLTENYLIRTREIIDGTWRDSKCANHTDDSCGDVDITLDYDKFKLENYEVDAPSWKDMTVKCKHNSPPETCNYQVFNIYIEKSLQTVQETTETDPVNTWEIPGVLAGYFGYIALVYNMLFKPNPKLSETKATSVVRGFLSVSNNQVWDEDGTIEVGKSKTALSPIS